MTAVRVAQQELRPFFSPKALAEYLSISERTVRDMQPKVAGSRPVVRSGR